MNELHVSIAEGKRDFSKIIRASEEKMQKIVVSRRGRPVAVIIPYEEHLKHRKTEALNKIRQARAAYSASDISASEAYESSRRELEDKS